MLEYFVMTVIFGLVFLVGYCIGQETLPRIPEKLRTEIEVLVTLYVGENSDTTYLPPERYKFTRQEVVSILAIALQQIKEIE